MLSLTFLSFNLGALIKQKLVTSLYLLVGCLPPHLLSLVFLNHSTHKTTNLLFHLLFIKLGLILFYISLGSAHKVKTGNIPLSVGEYYHFYISHKA